MMLRPPTSASMTAAAVATALLALAGPSRAQLSPGPLASPHATLDGSTKCFQCHSPGGAKAMDARCLDCHAEVAWTIERGRGLHGRSAKADCARCHPDHAGRDLELIRWDEGAAEKFAHTRAGFELTGKHAALACRTCHRPDLRRAPVAPLIERRDPARSWLGLETDCASCHADPHRAELGADCARCHDTRTWKPAPGFDHGKTAYPLTGKHATAACARCHLAPHLTLATTGAGQLIPRYKPLSHQECSACHRDPHAERFGSRCASCHVTDSFKAIRADGFDHDRTRYPLRGRHAQVACAGCHDATRGFGPRPAFTSCQSCHRDQHAGQATLAGAPADCAACHTVDGFRPSSFTAAAHAKSSYPLSGKHADVACAACHRQGTSATVATLGPARVIMRPPHRRCADCHADTHGGQLRARPDGGACESCHAVMGFKPSTYAERDHARLRLGLDGRHAEIACSACHGAERPGLPPPAAAQSGLGPARFAFALTEIECTACHLDPHAGRFAAGGARARVEGCRDCHDGKSFRPSTMAVAAHVTTGFPLAGAHRAAACVLCHAELKSPPPGSTLLGAAAQARALRFAEAPSTCAGCHQTPHGEQFAARPDRGACEACHDDEAFTPASRFDHNRDTAFRLDGAHARAACTRCHRSEGGAPGQARLIYRPLSGQCASCHGPNTAHPLPANRLTQGARP